MSGYLIYCRKSTESEDRQVLSIESQIQEMKALAHGRGIPVAGLLLESRSAKKPGRPVFNNMMARIARGEVAGIICWKLDRLARNPVDGGSVIWAMEQHDLEIVTPSQTFSVGQDNTLLMYIEFGVAHKYINDLSKNVRRGLRAKVAKGWYPSLAPLGYLNRSTRTQGERDIIPDPERYHLVRRMWDMMLSGGYTVAEIRRIANDQWKFRTRQMQRIGGKPLSESGMYRIFTDPFYCGLFEYPHGSSQWHKGRHTPMITAEEFDRVQVRLGRKGKRKPSRHDFAFTGLIRCGECGSMITAEEKRQLICSACKCKFSSRHRGDCPRCGTLISDMKHPTALHYVYYRCLKKKACSQPFISLKQIEAQIAMYLQKIEVPERIYPWIAACAEEIRASRHDDTKTVREAQQKAYDACITRLQNLVTLKTSPRNLDGSLLSDEEYEQQRAIFLAEKAQLIRQLEGHHVPGQPQSLERVLKTFRFASDAPVRFLATSVRNKRQILAALGSNLTLKDRILSIQADFPFRLLEQSLAGLRLTCRSLEPRKCGDSKGQSAISSTVIPTGCTQ